MIIGVWSIFLKAHTEMSIQAALILRDEDDLVKDRFIHNLKVSENYR